MHLNTIFTGFTNSGLQLVIRYPQLTDVQEMWKYINDLSQERTFIRMQGETITMEEEEKFIENQLDLIENRLGILLVALVDDKLAGVAGIEMEKLTEAHVGELGISIAKDYRGQGIGKILVRNLLQEAKKQLPQLEIVTLSVFSTNETGIALYKQFGFQEYGRIPKGIKLANGYVDHIRMLIKFK